MPFLIAYALPGLFQRHNWAAMDVVDVGNRADKS